tara:strand:- start:2379 stop:2675 length:297 start_codon:yes stop_codon:yes gene_type:complete
MCADILAAQPLHATNDVGIQLAPPAVEHDFERRRTGIVLLCHDKNFGSLHFRYRNYNTHDRRYIARIEAAGFESPVFGMEEKAVHMNWVRWLRCRANI